MDVLFSMAGFALASSISPGPVNLVALSSGACYGFRKSLRHVTGATTGFTALLLLIGLGLYEVLARIPELIKLIQWSGVAFLFYMAYQLAMDDGVLDIKEEGSGPSMMRGALMQWLNPKAWLASLAGMGLFVADGNTVMVWTFAILYFVVCYGSVACWAFTGSFLRRYVQRPARVRFLNRMMAGLLVASALYLLQG
ncbi:LysE family translocator [Pseudomonas sp. WAC2]|uniref:LysE family translocator n=1 Tax=Pseudomonas sp. WAC2 TaxID=3055057 RepID=UPI0025B2771A|nr:LysE family translocator [Pseudomonas sp. WAC2]MDN3234759.1 LysE family translocator [Pseudomonas sp. WAC2]